MAGNMLFETAIVIGISKIIEGISNSIHKAEKLRQEIQQAGETARSEFDSIQQNLSSTISTVDEVKQHYAELAQRVGDLGKATQNQGTLTTDDYKDFLHISNQLSDLFPGVYVLMGTNAFAASKGGRLAARFDDSTQGYDVTAQVVSGMPSSMTAWVGCQWIVSIAETTVYHLQAFQQTGSNLAVTGDIKAVRIA